MDQLLRFVTRRPHATLALIALVTLFAASRIVDVTTGEPLLLVDPSLDSMLPRHDPARDVYDEARALFGTDESVLVVLTGDDAFTPENLERVSRLTTRFEALDGVRQVTSLANSMNIRSVEGSLEIDPFIDDSTRDLDRNARARRDALDSPIYAGNLVTRDGRTTSLVVYLFDLTPVEIAKVDAQIREIVAEERGDAAVHVSGGTHIKAEMQRLLVADLVGVLPAAVIAMLAVGFLCFRNLIGIALPLSTVGIALVWTLAFVAELTGSINFITTAVPPLILVVGFAYTVHVVSAYQDALRDGAIGAPGNGASDSASEPTVYTAVRSVALPVLLTGATTCAGFVSLATSPLTAIQEFGGYTAIGVVASTILALTFAPATLAVLRSPPPTAAPKTTRFEALLERLAEFDVRNRTSILWMGAAVAALALAGAFQIEVGTDFVGNFPDDNEVRLDYDAVNEVLEGGNSFSVVVAAEDDDTFREPAALRRLAEIQTWLEAQPEVGGTTSFADYLTVLHRAFHDDDPRYLTVPDSRELVSQLLLFADDPELDSFVDARYATASIVVRSRVVESSQVAALADRADSFLASLPRDLTYHVTGNAVLMSRTLDDIALGQTLSLVTAFAIIYAILSLLFASFRIGFIALLPNALPVLVYFGILGFSGITLNTTSGLVACLVLGIAVDDTIHFLAHFNTESKRHASEALGVVRALSSVGKPVTYTTAGLCAGFLGLTMSQLQNQVDFAVLSALTLAAAWLVDVTFTPALAARLRIVTVWDVLGLDLGDDPRRSIPLFEGLRPTQARIVALLGSLHHYPEGHVLTRVGDPTQEMWVVVDGELRVFLRTDGDEVEFGTCRRGDTVGEVALFHGRRTADVVASTDVRLLRFTPRSLDRIQRRYPRIGARVFANLSKILAARVASSTDKVG